MYREKINKSERRQFLENKQANKNLCQEIWFSHIAEGKCILESIFLKGYLSL